MRPRIHNQEAAYIVELLKVATEIMTENEEYYKHLEGEVWRLEQIKQTDPRAALLAGLKEKREAYNNWRRLAWCAVANKKANNLLIEKYQAIANGKSHKGTYKNLNGKLFRHINTQATQALPDLLREPAPICELGVKQQPRKNISEEVLA